MWQVSLPRNRAKLPQLATSLGVVVSPPNASISPDRSELLVSNGVPIGSRLSAAELWVQPLPSGTPHRVGNIIAEAACWTPDGIQIVYAYEHAIMITNKDGSEPHQLAKVPGVVRAIELKLLPGKGSLLDELVDRLIQFPVCVCELPDHCVDFPRLRQPVIFGIAKLVRHGIQLCQPRFVELNRACRSVAPYHNLSLLFPASQSCLVSLIPTRVRL